MLAEADHLTQDSIARALRSMNISLAEAPSDAEGRRKWVRGPLALALKSCIAPPEGSQLASPRASIRQMSVSPSARHLVAA
jgi:hypothetical protein